MNKDEPPTVKTLNVVYMLWPLENEEEDELEQSEMEEETPCFDRFQQPCHEEPVVVRKIERYLVFSAN